jgi:ADP-ribosylglycohydrolase
MDQKSFEGFFPGMSIGDALGAPAQGLKPVRVNQLFGRLADFQEPDKAFEHSPNNWRLKGLYSFPTQQALAVAESLILLNAYDLNNIYESLRSLYTEQGGVYRGMDEVFRKVMDSRAVGDPPLSPGLCHPGIGNISRCLPFALYFKNNEEDLRRAILETCLLTNNDPRAIAGAAVCVRAASLLACDPDRPVHDPLELLENLRRFTRKSEEYLQDHYGQHLCTDLPISLYYAMSDSLDILPLCLKEKNRELVKLTILTEANRHQPPFTISVLNQDFAPSGVCYILYTLLTSRTFGMGIMDIINEGKESRAMGSLIGGLLGLRFGSSGMPEDWLSQIKGLNQLILRGRELYEGYPDWNERRDLALMEREFTEKENEEIDIRRQALLRDREKEEKRHPPRIKQASTINAKLPPQEEAPFAPPPSIVYGGNLPDPLQAKKDKALRGRKRIEWKEDRRKKKKEEK